MYSRLFGKNTEWMRNKFLIGYIVFLHVFLILVLVKSDFITRAGYRLGLIDPIEPEITEHYEQMVRYHERMDSNVPDGAIIFIGDSITQGLYVSAVFTPSVNYGIGNDTTLGVLRRLSAYNSLKRAGACVVAIGVNDLRRRDNEEILKNYSSIINALPANLPIIISGVIPVDERVKRELAETNKRIKVLNNGLKTLCDSYGKICIFTDSGPGLIDSSGNLKEEYHEGDGIHLNGEGNAAWIKDLKSAVHKVLQAGLTRPQR